MFEAEFTHDGDLCTFEVLIERFGLVDPALRPIAEIVHDVDVKDAKYGREEAPGVGQVVAGIAAAHPRGRSVRSPRSSWRANATYRRPYQGSWARSGASVTGSRSTRASGSRAPAA